MTQEEFMHEAVLLARKGMGFTSPNPLVGAVIVRKGEIIGSGYAMSVCPRMEGDDANE